MNKYKEELIFELYKDKPLKVNNFRKLIKEKYNMKGYFDLYRRIVNYQIQTYGIQLYNLQDTQFSENRRSL